MFDMCLWHVVVPASDPKMCVNEECRSIEMNISFQTLLKSKDCSKSYNKYLISIFSLPYIENLRNLVVWLRKGKVIDHFIPRIVL